MDRTRVKVTDLSNTEIRVETGTSRRFVYAIGDNDGFRLRPDEAWHFAQALQKHAYECGFIPGVGIKEEKSETG